MRSGSRNARIMCLGDSYTQGANTDLTFTNSYANAFPNLLAANFRAAGVTSYCNSTFGFHYAVYNGSGGSYRNNEDPRLAGTGGAGVNSTQSSQVQSIAGPVIQFPLASSTLSFTPANAVNTIKVTYLLVNNGAGHSLFTYNINGGSSTAIDAQSSTPGFANFTVTGSLGTNTVNMAWNGTGYVNFAGFECYNSAAKEVTIINCGWSGATAGNWCDTTNGYNAGYAIPYLAPDLTIICLGLNDLNTGVSVATYTANMQTLITQAKAVGDCLLVTGGPWDPTGSSVSYATQGGYWQAMHQLAVQNNLRIVDMYSRWGTMTAASALGLEAGGSFSQDCHPSATGQADYAQTIFNMLRAN